MLEHNIALADQVEAPTRESIERARQRQLQTVMELRRRLALAHHLTIARNSQPLSELFVA